MTLSSLTTNHCKILISVALVALATVLLSGVPTQLAANDTDQIGRLQIVYPWTRPAASGESTRLHMKIVNDGFDDLHVVKLTSPVATKVQLALVAVRGRSVPLPALTVLAHEVMDLGSSQFRIMLEGLSRDLRAGEQFPVTLHFAPFGRITTMVTVGETAGDGSS